MEHVVQFGINIDDNVIRQAVLAGAEKQIISSIRQDIMNKLFKAYYYREPARPTDPLSEFSKELVNGLLEENKEAIIEAAGKHLADRLSRTKAVKEMVKEVAP